MEKYAALCYPGMLPGVAMSCNYKGVVFTINTLVPELTLDKGTRKKYKKCCLKSTNVLPKVLHQTNGSMAFENPACSLCSNQPLTYVVS